MPNSNDASARSEAISKRAYELYLQRGSVSGHELDDWLAAEAELSREAAGETLHPTPVQPVVRRRSNRGDAQPPSNRRI